MELAVEQISTQWSEAKHLHPEVHLSDGTVGAEYQRIPGIQLLGNMIFMASLLRAWLILLPLY
jgi:hypothetical protein